MTSKQELLAYDARKAIAEALAEQARGAIPAPDYLGATVEGIPNGPRQLVNAINAGGSTFNDLLQASPGVYGMQKLAALATAGLMGGNASDANIGSPSDRLKNIPSYWTAEEMNKDPNVAEALLGATGVAPTVRLGAQGARLGLRTAASALNDRMLSSPSGSLFDALLPRPMSAVAPDRRGFLMNRPIPLQNDANALKQGLPIPGSAQARARSNSLLGDLRRDAVPETPVGGGQLDDAIIKELELRALEEDAGLRLPANPPLTRPAPSARPAGGSNPAVAAPLPSVAPAAASSPVSPASPSPSLLSQLLSPARGAFNYVRGTSELAQAHPTLRKLALLAGGTGALAAIPAVSRMLGDDAPLGVTKIPPNESSEEKRRRAFEAISRAQNRGGAPLPSIDSEGLAGPNFSGNGQSALPASSSPLFDNQGRQSIGGVPLNTPWGQAMLASSLATSALTEDEINRQAKMQDAYASADATASANYRNLMEQLATTVKARDSLPTSEDILSKRQGIYDEAKQKEGAYRNNPLNWIGALLTAPALIRRGVNPFENFNEQARSWYLQTPETQDRLRLLDQLAGLAQPQTARLTQNLNIADKAYNEAQQFNSQQAQNIINAAKSYQSPAAVTAQKNAINAENTVKAARGYTQDEAARNLMNYRNQMVELANQKFKTADGKTISGLQLMLLLQQNPLADTNDILTQLSSRSNGN